MIHFDERICRSLEAAEGREWLETNGLGGFASSTITGMNTRRYHGLLVAAVRPPTERVLLLSKLEETLIINGERFDLATNRYQETTIHPSGFLLQTSFRLDPFPIFTYAAGQAVIEKSVFMLHDENTTVVRYRFHAPQEDGRATLELRPLVAFRDYHSMKHEDAAAVWPLDIESGLVRLAPRGENRTQLFLAYPPAASLHIEGVWYKQFAYSEEKARGFDFREDLFNPGALTFNLQGETDTVDIIASTERHEAREAQLFETQERRRRQAITESVGSSDEYVQALRVAADQFIVRRRQDLRSVIAGYHWFTDWGRDTMISLAGLAFATGQFDTAREILLAFAEVLNEGLIPNRFSDSGEQPEYNTVDGTLWFVHAIGEFLRRGQDEQFVRRYLYERLKEIISWHERGTHYGIHVATDGLLRAGQAGIQLTWMDAKVGDYVVTPRTGKPVEIQALWYNALRTLEEIAGRFGDDAVRTHCRALAEGMRASFNGQFWNEAANCLFDYIDDNGKANPAIRPNQIFAVSLPHQLVTGERARRIVEVVESELLTPYGLRSLSPHALDYRGRYEGDAFSRDTAYHQGTVWAWLMGPFITAYLKVYGRSHGSLAAARSFLRAFRSHLSEAGLGQVSEIFDGDPPHTPRGCIAQAWSVAELLRCELEELA